jgi:hypothetical protein
MPLQTELRFHSRGTNNPHIGGPAGRQTPGDSPATSAAAAMVPGRTLPLEGSRSCPLAGDENRILKPKSRRPGTQLAPTISLAEKLSPAVTTSAPTVASTCPQLPRQRAPAAPKRTGRSSLPSSPRKREWDRPRTRVPPSRRTTCCETPGAAGHRRPDRGRNVAPWLGSSSSPSSAWLEDASSVELEDGFHPQKPEEEAGRQPTRRQAPAHLALLPSKDDEDP